MADIELGDKLSQYFSIQAPEGVSFQSFSSVYKKSTTDVFVLQYKFEDSPIILFEGEVSEISNP